MTLRQIARKVLPVPMQNGIKKALGSIHDHFSGDRFRPRYGARELAQMLGRSPRAREQSGLRIIAGVQCEARSAEASRWIAIACDQVQEMTRERLMVYGRAAPALRPGFPWGGGWWPDQKDVMPYAHPQRFAFIPRLALAVLGGRYSRDEFAALLHDWMRFASNEPHLPFISTFVVAQRLLATTCALQFLSAAGDETQQEHDDLSLTLLQIIGQDIGFLIPRTGTGYPNGHLLTERFIAWFIAAVYPQFVRGKLDPDETERQWLAELERQTYQDGGGFEHALYYQGLATEMATTYLLLKRKFGGVMSPDHVQRIGNMLRLQADLAGPDGNAPNFGDCADNAMLPLDSGTGTTAAAMRDIYRRLFEPSIFPLADGHPAQEQVFWLLGDDTPLPEQRSRGTQISASPDAGVFVFFDDDQTTRCIFRTGPAPGRNTMSGHMHADLMSICLVHKGVPLLVDSGTYTYRYGESGIAAGYPNWRKYFCGPHAHNGIVIGGEDPLGPVIGDFRSGQPSLAHACPTAIVEGEALSFVEAKLISAGPYTDVARGVVHVLGEYFLVYNLIGAAALAEGAVLPLQLDHRARVLRQQGHCLEVAVGHHVGTRIAYSNELELSEQCVGKYHPPGGWVSPRYGELLPAAQLLFRPRADASLSAFVLCLNPAVADPSISCHADGLSLAFKIEGANFCDVIIVNPVVSDALNSHFGVEFRGRLMWLRTGASSKPRVRAIDAISCNVPYCGIDLRLETATDVLSGRAMTLKQEILE